MATGPAASKAHPGETGSSRRPNILVLCMDQWPAPGMAPLTDRQREIVRWVAQGLSNKEIGRRMGISPTTVKTHLHNIFERAGINGRQQLAVHALRQATPAHPAPGTGVN